MSQLIDDLVSHNVKAEIDGRWWVAKPVPFRSFVYTTKTRLKGAMEILTGRAIAVHYKQDE